MGMAYNFNEGSEGGLLQSGLFYLARTGGREILKNRVFGPLTSVDAPKDSASSLLPSLALSPILESGFGGRKTAGDYETDRERCSTK